jgi:putative membrane-bound dehydrogenase-like protein
MRFWSLAILAALLVVGSSASPALAQKAVSPDFKVELIYESPDIEHPSVVTCDDQGNLFVGEDPMDMRGPTTKHIDRVVYIRWDENGQPIKTVFCENLAAVFGLIWHDGALYVMHAPLYSVFRDTNGDGVADERKDLATGFGPAAGVYGFNDHIVTGTRLGMDGKVYVSVGDKGIPKATGADGSTITLEGGGVVRMNLDGTELEVVTSGTRNHLDVAMDSLDNIFTYDNTDDGLGWWTRFTHHVPSGYYGYPYDYLTHPERHLPRMSEHGGGSPVGAACYREAAWPAKYRDAAFHCEWGKGKVQVFYLKKNGATFTSEMEDFLVKEGSEEFRPLDLCFSPDGKYMYLADWNFGGWVNPKRCGRLFRVSYVGKDVEPEPPRAKNSDPLEAQIKSLGHPAHSERMRAQHRLARMGKPAVDATQKLLSDPDAHKFARIHAIWTQHALMGDQDGYDPSPLWASVAENDKDSDVRGQALRALGEGVWVYGTAMSLEAKAGFIGRLRFFSNSKPLMVEVEKRMDVAAKALKDEDPAVRMHAAVALGRLGVAPDSLFQSLDEQDEFARFAMIQALRSIGDWSLAEEFLNSDKESIRDATLLALTGQYDRQAVSALVWAISNGRDAAFRARALAALAEVHRKADPYTGGWWGTQPARGKPARSKVHEWEGTAEIMRVLRSSLEAEAPEVRREAMKALSELKDAASIPIVARLALDADTPLETRQDALKALLATDRAKAATAATAMVSQDSTPEALLLSALAALADLKSPETAEAIAGRIASPSAVVRAAALEAYARTAPQQASAQLIEHIASDDSLEVRRAAMRVAGELELRETVPAIIAAADHAELQQDAILALAAMPDRRALGLYLQGLASKNQQVRDAARAACTSIKSEIGPEIIARHEANELSPEMRRELQAVFTAPAPIREWQIIGGWSKEEDGEPKLAWDRAPPLDEPIKLQKRTIKWQRIATDDPEGRIPLHNHLEPKGDVWSVAYAAIESPSEQEAAWVLGSDDQAILFINGEELLRTTDNRGWAANQNSGPAMLKKGVNHVYFVCGNSGGGWEMSLALRLQTPEFAFLFENVPPSLDLSAFREHAMSNSGDAERGRVLFNDLKGVACVTCHAVKGEGGKIGPDLVGVGAKYPREELIRSVLEPSARVAESYQLQTIVTDDGRIHSGVVRSENEAELELVDANGKATVIALNEIEERVRSTVSLMPNGLKDGMTLTDFADIVAYLESLKEGK